jgi:hypothetical protein
MNQVFFNGDGCYAMRVNSALGKAFSKAAFGLPPVSISVHPSLNCISGFSPRAG